MQVERKIDVFGVGCIRISDTGTFCDRATRVKIARDRIVDRRVRRLIITRIIGVLDEVLAGVVFSECHC